MARTRKKVEEAAPGKPQEQPIHDPEAERDEMLAEASEPEPSAPESEQSEPSSAASDAEESFITVRANPELRAARVRVKDASGKEWIIEGAEMRSVPMSALDRNPQYLIKA